MQQAVEGSHQTSKAVISHLIFQVSKQQGAVVKRQARHTKQEKMW